MELRQCNTITDSNLKTNRNGIDCITNQIDIETFKIYMETNMEKKN